MTQYWLTLHWPPRNENDNNDTTVGGRTGIFLADGKESKGDTIKPGDKVLIYRTKSSRKPVTTDDEDEWFSILRRNDYPGAGIVSVGSVISKLNEIKESEPEQYTDGSEIWWRYCARVRIEDVNGFVPREKVNKVLGYGKGFTLRLPGGLREIDETTYLHLCELYSQKRKRTYSPNGETALKAGKQCQGGESDAHKALKLYVANNPVVALGEEHLRTQGVEHCFGTGDRADIFLRDELNRVIGVEVKVEVSSEDWGGVLQAIKYRSMLEFDYGYYPGEGRAFLVAHKIDKKTQNICEKYNVKCFVIPRSKIKK